MSYARRKIAKAEPRAGKDGWGNPLCKRCHGRIPPNRKGFCSDECTREHRMLTSPEYLRQLVFERDGGYCSQCGFDCGAADVRINDLRLVYSGLSLSAWGSLDWIWAKLTLERFLKSLRDVGFRFNAAQYFRPGKRRMRSLWEADHILAIADGGGECDLENVQTLCLRCHSVKSADLRKKLLEKRR